MIDNEFSRGATELESLLDIKWRVNAGVERRHTGIGGLGGVSLGVGWKQVAEHGRRRRGCAGMTRWESGMCGIGEEGRDRRIGEARPKLQIGELGIPTGDCGIMLRDCSQR